MKSAIDLQHVQKSFKTSITKPAFPVLKDIHFSIQPGKITGFLGANGAGKTTTFKCILGLLFPDSGRISFFDHKELSNSVKARIGFMPERPQFPEHLTGKEFLTYYLQMYDLFSRKQQKEKVDSILKQVRLEHAANRVLKNYSKGMIQRLGIAQAIIHEPDLVILDEPMSGLDPDGRFEVSELILNIHKSGKTVFFSSHLLDDVQKLCEDLVILKQGQTLFQGSKTDFLAKTQTQFRIQFIKEGAIHFAEVKNIESLNASIDTIRKQGFSIIEVSSTNNLEQAYVNFQKDEV